MDADLQRRVQRYGWDKAAASYEDYWSAQLRPAQDLLLEMAVLRPDERVADVACGTGLITFRAAEAVGPGGRVLATDISDRMVEATRAEAGRRGLQQVTAERADAEAIRLPDGGFDVALCALGLMYVVEPVAALREMYRLLEPGGRVVAAVWGARRNCGWAEIFPIVERRVKSEVCPLFFQLGTGDALAAAFGQAGFGEIRVERLSTVLEYRNGDDAIGAAFIGGPVAMAYSRFDPAARAEAHGEYLASIAAHRRGEGYALPGEFVVASGVRRPAPR
jgi:ubiquinone/menaquinone biosynthesis C-methylase UbiE